MKLTKHVLTGGLILTAFLVSAIGDTGEASLRAGAKNDAVQIATALIAYKTEYGRFPAGIEGEKEAGGDLLRLLMGATFGGQNSREIVFLEAGQAAPGKGGLRDGKYVDPWGVPYKVVMDSDGDGNVVAGKDAVKVKKWGAAWSSPEEGISEEEQKTRYVTSWD